ncbi:hypothetical protein HBI46_119990 [Parastagonospora nodorum]|nr:hypothetical protein HBI09_082450 [Parastagonospora nodorum]KAH4988122.1 hypothetical protein HBI76_089810 [Parastagonospora nodorum]KAH5180671.1 hypothetical protein HBH68_181500 [Parastagonospora nodorum]KAH5327101.1 hypothetical protein HBI12_075920 [Parastagonospora nodorum]KAH5416402.1 hypothetical protein HBI46_119990 [Parastagonospora nodorum]
MPAPPSLETASAQAASNPALILHQHNRPVQIPHQAMLDIRFTSLSESRARVEGRGEDEDVEFGRQGGQDGPDGGEGRYVCYDAGEGGAREIRGGVEGGNGGGEDVEVVCGFGRGIGADDGAAAGGEVEGDGAADAFGGTAGEELESCCWTLGAGGE